MLFLYGAYIWMGLCVRVTAAEVKKGATGLQSVMDSKQLCHGLLHVQHN